VSKLRVEIPEPIVPVLFSPARYKVLYGGRGSAKSWSVARALLVKGLERPLRILCAREFQNSIQDSVHALLADQIRGMGLDGHYEIQRARIVGRNGTTFGFEGLRHNIASIKSYEGADICWVEEAQTVSKESWDILVPTIRKPESEIWVTFNPELDSDETWRRFVVSPPPNAKVLKVNWDANPWFPDVLAAEKDHLKATDPDAYLTVWEGHCRQVLEGAIYANEIRAATEDERITRVPYDKAKPVDVYFDIGWADYTSAWFGQWVGQEFHLIDYMQGHLKPWSAYMADMQKRGYVYRTVWLPHDAQAKELGTGKSIEDQTRAAGYRTMIAPQLSVLDGINAARELFNRCWFDAEKCADGLQCLRRYRWDKDETRGGFKRAPLHDEFSHGADAFRYAAVSAKRDVKAAPIKYPANNGII
jgi:phage terminase large subunit